MDEEVFLVFVPFALVIAGIAIFAVRRWESSLCWERCRISTALWTTMVTVLVAGFINMSDSVLLLGAWVLISGFLLLQVIRKSGEIGRYYHLPWALLVFTPGGWLLFLIRFPHLHGIDAMALRQSAAPSVEAPNPRRRDFAALCADDSDH